MFLICLVRCNAMILCNLNRLPSSSYSRLLLHVLNILRGYTRVLNRFTRLLKSRGASSIVITRLPVSSGSETNDVFLPVLGKFD